MHHVVILGAGFAGLNAAQSFRNAPVRVTLVDQNNYHAFQPLYYQVATAGLEPAEIAHNVRDILQRSENVDFRMGRVTGVELDAHRILLSEGPPVSYDTLIVATGAVTDYFGVEGAAEHSFGLKSLEDAVTLRNHILHQFEAYSIYQEAMPPGALTFVVVGGGATGVEVCGALVELFRIPLRHDFKTFDAAKRARVLLIEQAEGLLLSYPEHLQAYTRRVLERRGVEVRLGTAVERVEAGAVVLKGGERIDTQTLIWAAGIRANPVADLLGAEQSKGGRVVVEPDLTLPGHPDVFVIGDLAAALDEEGRVLPQLAPVAIQQGTFVARHVRQRVEGVARHESFAYKDRGSMATIGRNAAVAAFYGKLYLKGFLAWVAWVFLHLVMLIGFRNRANVFINWAYNYFTYDRGARLILTPRARKNPARAAEQTPVLP